MSQIIYPEQSYKIMGAGFEVYTEKGGGFLEAVFQECLEMKLADPGIPFVAPPRLNDSFKGRPLKQTYEPDFVCSGNILLAIKAVSKLTDEHRAQVHNCLCATGYRLAVLVNFGHCPKVEAERIAL